MNTTTEKGGIKINANISKAENITPSNKSMVRLKIAGNTFEIRYMSHNMSPNIQKLNKHNYVELATGELKPFIKDAVTRADNIMTVRKSLANLRDIINANVTNPNNCLWVTLTYAEIMTDEKRLYEDFRRFWQRFCCYLKRQCLKPCEYIATAEPQARRAWHLHVLFIWQEKKPFIHNDDMASLWKLGFTKTKSLKDTTNVGLYLTAYLTSLELSEAIQIGNTPHKVDKLKLVDCVDEKGQKESKAIIKGARISLYPVGFRIFRTSKGIKRPVCIDCTEQHAQEIIGNTPLIYEKTVKITAVDGADINTINYRHYNKGSGHKKAGGVPNEESQGTGNNP